MIKLNFTNDKIKFYKLHNLYIFLNFRFYIFLSGLNI